MGIAAELLGLRNRHVSSVSELLAALEQVIEAPPEKMAARVYLADAAADLVLTNVAAHAAEAMNEPAAIRKTRRAGSATRRKRRRTDSGQSPHQRILFAIS
jgi:hypothetical protein